METLLLLCVLSGWGASDYWRSIPHQDYHRAVVRVSQGQSNGSGVVIWKDNDSALVLTNWHVANEDVRTWVYWGHSGYRTIGEVFRRNYWKDLALIWVRPPADSEVIKFATREPPVGGMVELAGYGRTSYHLDRWYGEFMSRDDTHSLFVDCYMFAGHSGGPILYEGKLIGVMSRGVPVNRTSKLYWRSHGPDMLFVADYLQEFLQSEIRLERVTDAD